jgi:hypothetical protein
MTAIEGFVAPFAQPGMEDARQGLFGPVVPVPEDAPYFDQVLGLTGRDPQWSPSA